MATSFCAGSFVASLLKNSSLNSEKKREKHHQRLSSSSKSSASSVAKQKYKKKNSANSKRKQLKSLLSATRSMKNGCERKAKCESYSNNSQNNSIQLNNRFFYCYMHQLHGCNMNSERSARRARWRRSEEQRGKNRARTNTAATRPTTDMQSSEHSKTGRAGGLAIGKI